MAAILLPSKNSSSYGVWRFAQAPFLNRAVGGKIRIGIFGHVGNKNLGDEAIITAVIQNVRSRLPDAVLCCFSINPEDSCARHKVPAFPIRRIDRAKPSAALKDTSNVLAPRQRGVKDRLKRLPRLYSSLRAIKNAALIPGLVYSELAFLRFSYRNAKDIDLLIIAGSNQFLDNFGGAWGFPYTLFKWSVLAKLVGAKLAFVSVGAGPIDGKLSKWFIKGCLVMADYVSFRDDGSRQLIHEIDPRRGGGAVPDLAFSMGPQRGSPARTHSSRQTVGINPMPVYDSRYWAQPDAAKYENYVRKLAQFSSALLLRGHPVFFFSTQIRDELVISDICSHLNSEARSRGDEMVRVASSVEDLMSIIACADLIVATRFHGVLLALHAEKPVMAICYQKKTYELMANMEQSDYAFELDNFDVETMLARFDALEFNSSREISKLRKKKEQGQMALNEQYSKVLGLLKYAA